MKYKCLNCGGTVSGTYHERPQKGSYFKAKCLCGNRGSSNDWNYNIKGFAIKKDKSNN